MRETKFRVYSEKEDKMIFGYPVIIKGKFDSFIEDITGSRWGAESFKLELMQFTGLKDKNGTDIYKRDIVQIKVKNETLEIGEVVWHDDEIVGYRTIHYKNGLKYMPYLCGWYEYEILGNIYQHPELLEKK